MSGMTSHAGDDDRWLAPPIHDEALVILYSTIYDSLELGAGSVSIDAAFQEFPGSN
jgi:hypothetical protein